MQSHKSALVSREFMSRSEQIISKGLVNTSPQALSVVLFRSRAIYLLPVSQENIMAFGSISASPSHVGGLCNSVDFYCGEGTQIFAAAEGKVVGLRSDKNVHGNTTDFWDEGNYIEILHSNLEYTWYEHLRHGGVAVNLGEEVHKGQLIGYSGNTGFTENPHLHFQVHVRFDAGDTDLATLKVRFEDFENVYNHIGLKPFLRT